MKYLRYKRVLNNINKVHNTIYYSTLLILFNSINYFLLLICSLLFWKMLRNGL